MELSPGVLVLSLPIPIIAGNFEAFHKANQVIILIFINVIIVTVGVILVFCNLTKISTTSPMSNKTTRHKATDSHDPQEAPKAE